MQKNSTLFSTASVVPQDQKDMKSTPSQEVPGDAVIRNILNFSKALEIRKSRETGLIEVVLN